MPTQATADHRSQWLSPVWSRYTSLEVVRGEGVYLFDRSGQRYLDFTSGIGVTNTGHCHPVVVDAIKQQAERLLHGQATIVYHLPLLDLVEELRTILPPEFDSFFFANSGTEAVESALKLAHHATGRANVIAFQGAYHGRTVGAMAITTAKASYRVNYQPLMPGVHICPYPYAYRYRCDPDQVAAWCLDELRHVLDTQAAPEETAAMIVEPVLGEGGYVVPPTRFLHGLREVCDEFGILLIFDEVQTGFGRTGRMFACEHFRVRPDILVMSKGIASGLPLSAIASRRELMARWRVGSHGGTFGGNAVAAAAAVTTIRVLREEALADNAARQGRYLLRRLCTLQARFPPLGDVRGLGLMVGCEIVDSHGRPDRAAAHEIRTRCLDNRLLLLTCGYRDHVIRWVPPLIVEQAQIDHALAIFQDAVEQACLSSAGAPKGSPSAKRSV